MQKEERQIGILIGIGCVLCAGIIFYNLFFSPAVVFVAAPAGSALHAGEALEEVPSSSIEQKEERELESVIAQEAPPAESTTGKINLNTATAQELEALDGIGEVLAGRILAYREEYGGFSSTEELKKIEGIGEERYLAIQDAVSVE